MGVLSESQRRRQDEQKNSESHTQDSTRDPGKTDERHGKLSNPARLSLASLKGGRTRSRGTREEGGTRDGDLGGGNPDKGAANQGRRPQFPFLTAVVPRNSAACAGVT